MRILQVLFAILLTISGLLCYSHAFADVATGNGAATGCGSNTASCGNGGGPTNVGNGGWKCTQGNGKGTAVGCTPPPNATPGPMVVNLSGYAPASPVPTGQWAKYDSSVSDVEVGSTDWNDAHSIPPNNGQTYTIYTDMSQWDGFTANDEAVKAMEYHETDFMHDGDPADLSATPGNAQCTIYFNTDHFDSGSTGTYKLYNAANDTLIATITGSGSSPLSYTKTGLTNGTTYYYYVDWIPVNTTVTSNIATGSQTVTVASGTNIQLNSTLKVCDAGSTNCENIHTINSGTNTMTAVFAKAHTCSSGSPCTVYGENSYSSVDPIEGYAGVVTTTLPNTTGELGKRLSNIANANGLKAPSCTPAVSPALSLSNYSVTLSPNPRPAQAAGASYRSNTATPAPGATITVGASVTEVGSSSAPTIKWVNGPSSGQAWSTVTGGTWSAAGNVWTFSGGTFTMPSPSNSNPTVFEICQGSTCTLPFAGPAQAENERMTTGNASTTNYIRMLWQCSAQMLNDTQAVWNNAYFGSMHLFGTTYPARSTDGGRFAPLPQETYFAPDLWSAQSSYEPTVSGSWDSYGSYGGQYAECGTVTMPDAMINWDKSIGIYAYNYTAHYESPTQEAILGMYGSQMNLYDDFLYGSASSFSFTSMGTSNLAVNFVYEMNTAATGPIHGDTMVLHPVLANTSPLTAQVQTDFMNSLAAYYLVGDGNSLRIATDSNLWTYNITNIQIRNPSSPATMPTATVNGYVQAQIGPQATCPQTCDYSQSGGEWNATDQMFERSFTNGMAFYCPPSGGTNQTACKTHSFGTTVYQLNPPTDSVENGDTANTWTSITSLTLSANSGAVIEYSKL